jgi:glycosyltransferase involved in cell wall biosynthesis
MAHKITTIILTFNEAIHIERCIRNAKDFSDRIVVVDSFSSDDTVLLAKKVCAEVFLNEFKTQAQQFNWALENIGLNPGELVVRLDADEFFDSTAIQNLRSFKEEEASDVIGLSFNRRIIFQGEHVRFGGLSNKWIVRAFVYPFGQSNGRLMDEHITVRGSITKVGGCLYDECLKGIDFWMSKHIKYAQREAIEVLRSASKNSAYQTFYYLLPSRVRPILFFIRRFIFQIGFLDKQKAKEFHYLQAFWYRQQVEKELYRLRSLKQKQREKVIAKYLEL